MPTTYAGRVMGRWAGGAIGGVGVSAVASGTVTLLDRLKRGAKCLYKTARGTRGEHRLQCAQCLLYCATFLSNEDPKQKASDEALYVLLDEEYDEVMAMTAEKMTARLADRLKSN